ncbi:MAG: hypothetical protein AB8H12_08825 [Lewinella sp.]
MMQKQAIENLRAPGCWGILVLASLLFCNTQLAAQPNDGRPASILTIDESFTEQLDLKEFLEFRASGEEDPTRKQMRLSAT